MRRLLPFLALLVVAALLEGPKRFNELQDELDGIADSMNNRPRATHEWHTPLQVSAQTLASSHQPAASIQ